uniref:Uncharacterized protein n=1 Tax=Anguilla anguilla TaxID=7936 RepID=A0A0E9QJK5_ANGAN
MPFEEQVQKSQTDREKLNRVFLKLILFFFVSLGGSGPGLGVSSKFHSAHFKDIHSKTAHNVP